MRLKLDENLSRHLGPELLALGHDVETVAGEGLLSRPDTEIASAAQCENRMLFTLDTEFADLRKHTPGSQPGIIVFRPQRYGPLSVNAFVLDFVRSTDLSRLSGCICIVDPGRMRVRAPEVRP
jgi:predicted nuclease of predicted toxin-antitoxin system